MIIILSIGSKAKVFASEANVKAPNNKTPQTKRVLTILIIELVVSIIDLSETNRSIGSPVYSNPTETGSNTK